MSLRHGLSWLGHEGSSPSPTSIFNSAPFFISSLRYAASSWLRPLAISHVKASCPRIVFKWVAVFQRFMPFVEFDVIQLIYGSRE